MPFTEIVECVSETQPLAGRYSNSISLSSRRMAGVAMASYGDLSKQYKYINMQRRGAEGQERTMREKVKSQGRLAGCRGRSIDCQCHCQSVYTIITVPASL